MVLYIPQYYPDQVIQVPVVTRGPQRLSMCVYHDSKPNTCYFRTSPVINGPNLFTIKIPKCPEGLVMELYNESNGNIPYDPTFRVGKINVGKLRINIVGIMNETSRKFAEFIDDFAEDAGILTAQNNIFTSLDGKFRIHYKDVIRDDKGNELRTPARVNANTKEMEFAKKHCMNMTVPGRKAIAWHEYSHVYKNVNPSDEFEADKNAIFMYLGTGNPKIEAFNVFIDTFKNTPTPLNVRRSQELGNYIKNYESIQNSII